MLFAANGLLAVVGLMGAAAGHVAKAGTFRPAASWSQFLGGQYVNVLPFSEPHHAGQEAT